MTVFAPLPSPFLNETFLASLDVLVKATVLMLLALALNALLRGRRRVLARSAVFNALLAGLVLLPAASLAFPRLRVPCLPALTEQAAPAPEFAPTDSMARDWPPGTPNASTLTPAPVARPVPWLAYVWDVYRIGVALFAARLLISLHAVRRLRRTGRPLSDPAWTAPLHEWQSRLGITGRVELTASPAVTVPLAFGWLRPVVMIPETLADTLSGAQREAVLLHELAHIRRGDYAWQLLLKFVQAAYWVHPLVWVVGRHMSAAREQACDDLCTYHAATPQDYRATLMEIVSQLVRRPAASLGIAMANTTRIARRLERIDATHRCARCVSTRPARALAITLALVAAAAIGPIEPARRAAAEPAPPPVVPSLTTRPATGRPPGTPRFRCDEPVYNFPDVWAGDKVKHTWTVHNDGDAALEILEVRPGCGCIVCEYDRQIQPGGQGKITVELRTQGLHGDITKNIIVRTNDPDQTPPSLQPKGRVNPCISMDPPSGAQFPRTEIEPHAVRTVTITNHTDRPLKLEADTMPGPVPFSYAVKEITPGKVFQIIVTPDQKLTDEGFFPLAFKTGLAEEPRVVVPVNLPPLIQASAASVLVTTPVAAPFQREITLRYNGHGAMNILGVSTPDPRIKLQTARAGDEQTWKLRLDIPAGWSPPPLRTPAGTPAPTNPPPLEIVVRTDVKARPEVRIRIYTYPQTRPARPPASAAAAP